jgi:small-conductance mechanosensitive channel
LAEVNLDSIKKAIEQERELNRTSNIGKRLGWIILILSLLFLIIHLINLLFRKLTNYLKNKIIYLHGRLGFLKFLLHNQETFDIYLFKIIGFLRLTLQVMVVIISFPILFSILPVTRTWTVTLLGWVLNPLNATLSGIWLYLPKLFAIIVIYLVFKYALRLLHYVFSKISDGTFRFDGFHKDWATPTFSIVRFLLYAFMLVLIFPLLPGSDSDAFKGISVFLGILFSLGSSSVIGNILAGLVITYMRPFQIGDRIKIGEITGDVIEKTSLVTRIRTVKNEDITVPNSSILHSSCINYSANAGKKGKGLIIYTSVTIGYDVQWRLVHETLLKAASRTESILKKPEPFVLQTSLDDFSVAYQLNGYTKEANSQAMVYSTLHQNIQDCCNEAGIEIMSPHYTNLRDGSGVAIPAEYLTHGSSPPPHIVE